MIDRYQSLVYVTILSTLFITSIFLSSFSFKYTYVKCYAINFFFQLNFPHLLLHFLLLLLACIFLNDFSFFSLMVLYVLCVSSIRHVVSQRSAPASVWCVNNKKTAFWINCWWHLKIMRASTSFWSKFSYFLLARLFGVAWWYFVKLIYVYIDCCCT